MLTGPELAAKRASHFSKVPLVVEIRPWALAARLNLFHLAPAHLTPLAHLMVLRLTVPCPLHLMTLRCLVVLVVLIVLAVHPLASSGRGLDPLSILAFRRKGHSAEKLSKELVVDLPSLTAAHPFEEVQMKKDCFVLLQEQVQVPPFSNCRLNQQ